MKVVWATADPEALARYLADALEVRIETRAGSPAVVFPGGSIVIAKDGGASAPRTAGLGTAGTGTASRGRLSVELVDPDGARRTEPATESAGVVDLVGVGWATVELDRAVLEFTPLRFDDVAPDALLGARARVARVGTGSLVLLEPSTEGRLAAELARSGEGPAALYLAAAPGGLVALAERRRRAGDRARIADGPFGRSFVIGASPWGPHLVVCEEDDPLDQPRHGAGTIAR